jgi:hypothetical protein
LFFNAPAPIRGEDVKSQTRKMTTMTELTGNPGFAPPRADQSLLRRHGLAIEWIATGALTISLIIAATAVSMGERSLARTHNVGQPAQTLQPRL